MFSIGSAIFYRNQGPLASYSDQSSSFGNKAYSIGHKTDGEFAKSRNQT